MIGGGVVFVPSVGDNIARVRGVAPCGAPNQISRKMQTFCCRTKPARFERSPFQRMI